MADFEGSAPRIRPVILSGGSGTRLWPLSRALYPKQLQPLHSSESLLQETAHRVAAPGFLPPVVICNDEHRFMVAEQLRATGVKPQAIVLEPVGRSTAPAAGIAALMAHPDEVLLILPSDHVIKDGAAFHQAVAVGAFAASTGRLVAFGITPNAPETGYGYIKRGAALEDAAGAYAVEAFVEKPDRATAEAYLSGGGHDWNGGIFLFTAGQYLAELDKHQPGMSNQLRTALSSAASDLDFNRLDGEAFAAVTNISIDYAVMEKTANAAVVPVEMGWSDVGAWDALWEIEDKDADGNVLQGDVIAVNVRDAYVRSEGQLVAVSGLSDAVVVATADAVLVTTREHAQGVKDIVDRLKSGGRTEHENHVRVYRPWGWYQSLEQGTRFQVKLIEIKPGARISLQRHAQRAEHWVVVSGRATATRGEETITLDENQSTYIPIGMTHRLANETDQPLRIIEVQSGEYLGEDDIERFDDNYGRT